MPLSATVALSTWHQCCLHDTWCGLFTTSVGASFQNSSLPLIRMWMESSDAMSSTHRLSCSEGSATNKEAPRHHLWARKTRGEVTTGQAKSPLRLFFTTKLEDMDAKEVSELVASIDRNHHRGFSSNPNDVLKWERALQHSIVSVAVFAPSGGPAKGERWLVGFGRAISDTTLTASIHDLVIAPDFQRQGLGKRVLQKIVKDLRKRGILDIAIVIPDQLTGFFGHQGFEADRMESVTMVYNIKDSSQLDALNSSPLLRVNEVPIKKCTNV